MTGAARFHWLVGMIAGALFGPAIFAMLAFSTLE